MNLIEILMPQNPAPVVGARLVAGVINATGYVPPKRRKEDRKKAREYQRRRRAKLVAAGLTTKGRPRKGL